MELNEFLVKAKKNTYAMGGEGGEKKYEDGMREFIYEEGEWKYRDRYFGSHTFIGQEIVWHNSKAVWGMNYYGDTLSESVDAGELYGFLKKALLEVDESTPFRGPKELRDGDFFYGNSWGYSLERFRGQEIIFHKDKKMYELRYEGGVIKP